MNLDPLLEVFFAEADELLAECEEALVALEAAPGDRDLLNRIFRMAHTLKSNSAMLGFVEISQLTHALEDLLDQLRQGNREANRAVIDILLRSRDVLRAMLERARSGNAAAEWAEVSNTIVAQLRALLNEAPALEVAKPTSTLADADPSESELPQRRRSDREEATSIRVPVERIDRLINLVGELVIAQSMVSQAAKTLGQDGFAELREAVAQMDRHAHDLHERIMSIRMVPVRNLFGRFPRLVRDLTARTGKQAKLEIHGEETELDKTVIEKIGDPIVHLIRNAIDHGLERPEERRTQGKPETGILRVEAYQQGGRIFIEVADDGRGLDPVRIRERALREGLLQSEDPVSDETLFGLVFRPGFSTAEQVTELSGRGVGMDVVKRNLALLGGSITIHSERGRGTCFRISLPLTVAILDGQLVRVGDQTYLLPLVSILESIRPEAGSTCRVAGSGEVMRVRGQALPLLRLHRLFGIEAANIDPAQGLMVIVEQEGQKAALLVDEILGQQQVVIKSLETGLGKVEGIAGATILGDGRVCLILDVLELLTMTKHRETFVAATWNWATPTPA